MMNNLKLVQEEMKELISEVSKKHPDQSRVKSLVKKLDIEFSSDPIEQMTLVLNKINLAGLGRASKDITFSDNE